MIKWRPLTTLQFVDNELKAKIAYVARPGLFLGRRGRVPLARLASPEKKKGIKNVIGANATQVKATTKTMYLLQCISIALIIVQKLNFQ